MMKCIKRLEKKQKKDFFSNERISYTKNVLYCLTLMHSMD